MYDINTIIPIKVILIKLINLIYFLFSHIHLFQKDYEYKINNTKVQNGKCLFVIVKVNDLPGIHISIDAKGYKWLLVAQINV